MTKLQQDHSYVAKTITESGRDSCHDKIGTSGLKSTTYEEKLKELGITTLEERRHQSDRSDMVQTFKILHGYDRVNCDKLFVRAEQTNLKTRSATGPLN